MKSNSLNGKRSLADDREEDQLRHARHGVARGEVLAHFLVEAPDQLLEEHGHKVVVEPGVSNRAVGLHHRRRTQVDVGRGDLLDQRAQGVGPV